MLKICGVRVGGLNTKKNACSIGYFDLKEDSPLILSHSVSGSFSSSIAEGGDTKLLEFISDTGGADLFVLNQGFQLPPCLSCNLECPGSLNCKHPNFVPLTRAWKFAKEQGIKRKRPLPYMDTLGSYILRKDWGESLKHSFFSDLEPSMGSNKAPVFARTLYVIKAIKQLYPNATFVYTLPSLAILGLCQRMGGPDMTSNMIRNPLSGLAWRTSFVAWLRTQKYVTLSAQSFLDAWDDFAQNWEPLESLVCALMGTFFLQPQKFFDLVSCFQDSLKKDDDEVFTAGSWPLLLPLKSLSHKN